MAKGYHNPKIHVKLVLVGHDTVQENETSNLHLTQTQANGEDT